MGKSKLGGRKEDRPHKREEGAGVADYLSKTEALSFFAPAFGM